MKRSVLIGLLIATLLKLLLAALTIGTNDVVTWRAFANNAIECGHCVYYRAGPYGDLFNHPPFIIHFLKLLGHTQAFPFWLRLPSILADIGTVFLVTRLFPNLSRTVLLLLVLNPVSILISGFHGNTDPIMILFLLVAIYFCRKENFWIGGVAFAMALSIKVVPLLLLPWFLVYSRQRIVFGASVVLAIILLSLPYALDPKPIITHVLGYQGSEINWGFGLSWELVGVSPFVLAKWLLYLIVVLGLILPWYLRRKRHSLFAGCAAILFVFYFVTPSLGVQYLAWGVPFLVLVPARWMASYYLVGGGWAALQYHRWSGGHWVYANSYSVFPSKSGPEFLGLVLWLCCAVIAYLLLTSQRVLAGEQLSLSAHPPARNR